MDELPASNIPEYTVTEISGAVKRTLEGAFGRVRVRGEITELKRYPSGHIYFSLKDEGGKIAGVVWKSAVSRLGLDPENGVEVIAQGKISAYGDRSTYQLIVERMDYAGAGALLARIELLRARLAAEGLFDAARKKSFPLLPEVVGVVTSERGAVIQDIRTTIQRRFPRHILLWPVPVQGEGAAAKIAEAIRGFDALPKDGPIPRPDVLIVARGGGSLEDLMAFNEEVVVRAAAACRIPLISAVGHETDTTLIDHVSDRRAPTPTAAAEIAVPSRVELAADLQQKGARLIGALNRLAQECRLRLQRAERGLPDLPNLVGTARQRLDDRAARLGLALPNLLAARRTALERAERGLPDLPTLIAAARQRLDEQSFRLRLALPSFVTLRQAALTLASEQLRSALRHAVAGRAAAAARVLPRLTDAPLRARLREARARLEGVGARLESVSHTAVLARGYALVFDRAGAPVTSAKMVRSGMDLRLQFADGDVRAVAGGRAESRQRTLPL
ncbi:exodeoxyribonuclease VII large subunit [Limobrevibacterium gyesilva]|uniref:Exodeoxyribonuclease 7 large subunit n=1 Tax=Limobrevibacterium gyesilva TaxID=2991712 RepID=A0AA42CEC6_9PROT|nr:exodeoxyribonuclease VII large subunit [Limobrevibacterium gyesilva]MCW3473341.1 exodeoxyribonuclease VII large subunit [Limobrevibacterium gyesilva]